MIHLLPFTYLPEALIEPLYSALGAVAVCEPLADLTPTHMRAAAEKGVLELVPPPGIDPMQLRQVLANFSTWAELHQGRGADLIGQFRGSQLQAAGQGEADAHQIRDQIKKPGHNVLPAGTDHGFEAALFLCLAHTYDQQQATVDLDLGRVQSMEAQLGRILGEPDPDQGDLALESSSHLSGRHEDLGNYMTQQRLESWARLSLDRADETSVFVTTSRAVWDELLEQWPQAVPAGQYSLPNASAVPNSAAGPSTSAELRQTLLQLTASPAPVPPMAEASNLAPSAAAGPALILFVIPRCPPREFLSKWLPKRPTESAQGMEGTAGTRTVLGLVSF
ncbi:MAG: hypothetical protein M0036_15420 [Desulfobacteraceae bacterium]|nr:hypothetical protein [Desulfobacteraceae bacterium]